MPCDIARSPGPGAAPPCHPGGAEGKSRSPHRPLGHDTWEGLNSPALCPSGMTPGRVRATPAAIPVGKSCFWCAALGGRE
eukprot:9486391-Pyramimonas_sp.AAC.1